MLRNGLISQPSFKFIFWSNLLDDFWDKERANEQTDGEKHLKRDRFSPVSGGPDLLQGSDKNGEGIRDVHHFITFSFSSWLFSK
ncbi:MAG TPA: hypothetical protein HPQ03_12325 [Deltaproteobacteria bacterium]|nr:hypothetical protein [Deltaproteobacteria bacterium]